MVYLEHCDVLVIGAGFSGLSASKILGEAGINTIVLEQNPSIGIPVRSSGGTWLNEMLKLGVPKEFLFEVEELKFFLHDKEIGSYKSVIDKGAVLRIREYLQWIAEELPYPSVKLLLKTKPLEIFLNKNEIEVKTDKGLIKAGFLIDCSGSWAFTAKKFGLINEWNRYAIGAEYEVFIGKEMSTSAILMSNNIVKSGYAWLFPLDNRVRIGVGVIRPFSEANPMKLLDKIVIMFRKLLLKDVPKFIPIELHAGIFPCQGILKTLVIHNIVLAGDAGSLGSPLIGEGIRYAIITGRKSAEIVLKAFSKNDYTILGEYEKWVNENLRKDFEIALKIQTLAATASDDEISKFVELFNKLYQKNPIIAEEFFKSRLTNIVNRLDWYMNLNNIIKRDSI